MRLRRRALEKSVGDHETRKRRHVRHCQQGHDRRGEENPEWSLEPGLQRGWNSNRLAAPRRAGSSVHHRRRLAAGAFLTAATGFSDAATLLPTLGGTGPERHQDPTVRRHQYQGNQPGAGFSSQVPDVAIECHEIQFVGIRLFCQPHLLPSIPAGSLRPAIRTGVIS